MPPLTDDEFNAVLKWLVVDPEEARDRLDFVWNFLNSGQKTATLARVKTDVGGDFDAVIAKLNAHKSSLTDPI